jgi:heptosyltransferase-2
LLAAESWPVTVHPKGYLDRVRVLRKLVADIQRTDSNFKQRENALIFSKSFSSALEMRLAGLRAVGYGSDGRRWLLQRSFPLPSLHKLLIYWELATDFLGVSMQPPASIDLAVTGQARFRVAEVQRRFGLERYVVLCPFATGDIRGASKRWPWFAELAQLIAEVLGVPAVLCPGPGTEEAEARDQFDSVVVLNGLGLSEYAAVLQGASLVIANDTGPGHIAAAVGTPLISLFGASDPARYGPWGPNVTLLNEAQGWPSLQRVLDTAHELIRR